MTTNSNRKTSLQTRVAQALHFIEGETGAVVPSIQPTSTYARDDNYALKKDYMYRRDGSQATQHAETIIAELEDAEEKPTAPVIARGARSRPTSRPAHSTIRLITPV